MAAPPFQVKAIYDYASQEEDDLKFSSGQVITVTEEEDADWYFGGFEKDGLKQEGLFPKNFVKILEPEAPPRPARSARAKKDHATAPTVDSQQHEPMTAIPRSARDQDIEVTPAVDVADTHEEPAVASKPQPIERPKETASESTSLPPSEQTLPPSSAKAGAMTAEKGSSNAFRDRINAFNKPTAPPVAPLKPGNLSGAGGSGFVKKPFVAPPPSKNAYVPPPREAPAQKIYRREEDPDLVAEARHAASEDFQAANVEETAPAGEGDEPKPTSLKDRIALLQKQQMEQAARHAEASHKKEKTKRPKPVDAHEKADEGDEALDAPSRTSTLADEEDNATALTAQRRRQPREVAAGDLGISREVLSDGNDADQSGAGDTEEGEETSTGQDDSDNKPARKGSLPPAPMTQRSRTEQGTKFEDSEPSEEDTAGEDEEPAEDIDPEVRRRMEIRERMAKMSGGMGMAGMFGPPGVMPPKPSSKKASGDRKLSGTDDVATSSAPARAAPVPVMALPGLHKVQSPDDLDTETKVGKEDQPHDKALVGPKPQEDDVDIENAVERRSIDGAEGQKLTNRSQDRQAPPPMQNRAPPPVPSERPVPPPPSSRPAPPPPPQQTKSPSEGSESDDELSSHDRTDTNVEHEGFSDSRDLASSSRGIPIRAQPEPISTTEDQTASNISTLPSPPQSRAPPPPPSTQPLRRASSDAKATSHDKSSRQKRQSEEEITEYEGDYDTDLAPGEPHKDALKAHARSPSFEDDSLGSEPTVHHSGFSNIGSMQPNAPRAVPPPPPPNVPSKKRQSSEAPRLVPPPPPPPKQAAAQDDVDYDPYRYSNPVHGLPSPQQEEAMSGRTPTIEEPKYNFSPPPPQHRRQASSHQTPDQSPASSSLPFPQSSEVRHSTDLHRTSMSNRRSADAARPSGEHFIAGDIDLGEASHWWIQPQTPPPVLANRRDVIYEVEENSTSRRGGKVTINKDVYVLFMDYSQTTVSVQFETADPSSVTKLEQKHDPPPRTLRQDQLEKAHEVFGGRVADMAKSKEGTVVGDGTPHNFAHELITAIPEALPPVGVRAYGALVYANLANATVQQHDEIRPGDVVTFRNAKFGGHRGPMKSKYSIEVGKPDHVGIVVDWDGTKKKIRAWEQGRESKKVKIESFKFGDMKSGEAKVWRVMGREYVNWK